ncbi:MAG TPA: MXAN_6577-like cysteine-rich protein [Kofleriaceae bacterium]|nr:MXAN_6577-like cysteine-rich protein [Kofleriaceae bacterium]
MKHLWLAFLLGLAAIGCGNITRECPSGLTDCDGTCADMQSDNQQCGECGNTCNAMEQCVAGTCQCTSGGKLCGANCVDTATDEANCGDCGVACGTGLTCNDGTCGCPSNQMDCSGTCIDTMTDSNNCGSCGHACLAGAACINGGCGCPTNETQCGTICANTQTDNSHCGNCTTVCGGGKTCQTGSCACTGSNILECNGACINKLTDNSNCGACGTTCSGGKTCQTGSCQCTGGQTACGGTCYDVSADRAHCGTGCGVCSATQLCQNGCAAAPSLVITSQWESPTGWLRPTNQPIAMTFALSPASTATGITYECRTYLASGTPPAFAPCDGSTGVGTTYRPAAQADGTYKTEVRYLQNGVAIGSPTVYTFYAHRDLNNAAKCPLAPTDTAYFTAAANYATANPALFPIPAAPLFTADPALKIANPFINVPFKQVKASRSMLNSASTWGTFPKDFVVKDLSLRHSFILGNSNKLLMMKRNYAAAGGSCQNLSQMHHVGNLTFNFAMCDVFILNINGIGLCVGRNASTNQPEVKGTPYVAGWWRMRTVRYPSRYMSLTNQTRSSAYCATPGCRAASSNTLIELPP